MFLFIHFALYAQEREALRIMFYNVENLFDIEDDSTKNDNDFLPEGRMHWNKMRYNTKLNHIYKVIIGVGEWAPPEIIGLCEIENHKVLNDLCIKTPLSKFEYKIVHYDSPDYRGIDVALLYLNKKFKVVHHMIIPVNFPNEPKKKTRDILYVKGIGLKTDTLHIYVNHWPSRRGGQSNTEKYRIHAARILKHSVDSILTLNPSANIVLMGDFNDDPENESIKILLNTHKKDTNDTSLCNISHLYPHNKAGTLKYRGTWNTFDQFIVSSALIKTKTTFYVSSQKSQIYAPEYLLIPDDNYTGKKPFRTYTGPTYKGGFSDHLPIYIDIWK